MWMGSVLALRLKLGKDQTHKKNIPFTQNQMGDHKEWEYRLPPVCPEKYDKTETSARGPRRKNMTPLAKPLARAQESWQKQAGRLAWPARADPSQFKRQRKGSSNERNMTDARPGGPSDMKFRKEKGKELWKPNNLRAVRNGAGEEAEESLLTRGNPGGHEKKNQTNPSRRAPPN